MHQFRNILRVALASTAVAFSQLSLATNIVLYENESVTIDDPEFINGQAGEPDYFRPQKRNTAGVSNNRFTTFEVVDDVLHVYNGVRNTDGTISDKSDSAKVIILNATNIDLRNKIKIIGAPASLLITASSQITCNSCSFDNVERVTLLAGQNTSNNGAVQTLATTNDGRINVDSLSAPGAVSVDFIADVRLS
mgnify:CR=1 FL=1